MTNYLEGVIQDIIRSEKYSRLKLQKEFPRGDTEDDYALYLTQKHLSEIKSWGVPIEISRGPEGRYLEDQSLEVQAVEVFLEFLRALVDP